MELSVSRATNCEMAIVKGKPHLESCSLNPCDSKANESLIIVLEVVLNKATP